MPKCAVKKCKNNTLTKQKQHGISYFRFPQNGIRREKWRLIIAKERCDEYFKPNDSSVVCSDHFGQSDKYYTPKGLLKINKNAVPNVEVDNITEQSSENTITSLNLPTQKSVTSRPESPQDFSEKCVQPEIKNEELISPIQSRFLSTFNTPVMSFFKKTIKKYKRRLNLKSNEVRNLKKRINRLVKRNMNLKQIIKHLKKIKE